MPSRDAAPHRATVSGMIYTHTHPRSGFSLVSRLKHHSALRVLSLLPPVSDAISITAAFTYRWRINKAVSPLGRFRRPADPIRGFTSRPGRTLRLIYGLWLRRPPAAEGNPTPNVFPQREPPQIEFLSARGVGMAIPSHISSDRNGPFCLHFRRRRTTALSSQTPRCTA